MPTDSTPNSPRRRIWFALKWLLFAAVVVFVARRGAELWRQDAVRNVELQPGWLLPAAVAYLAGWIPSVWFWRRLLVAVGGEVSSLDAARAYYCGHLGKYIPGKATVLIIRAAMVKDRGSHALAAAITATYETLAMMGIGLAVAVALSPTILGEAHWERLPTAVQWWRNHPLLIAAAVTMATLAALPLLSKLFTWISVRMALRGTEGADTSIRIDTQLLLSGCVGFVVAWACHGLSLGLTIRAVSPAPLALSNWPMWTAATAVATSVGFFALFAPGGIGIREGLLIEALRIQPDLTAQQAVVAALLLRAVWFAAEIAAAVLLYYMVRPKRPT